MARPRHVAAGAACCAPTETHMASALRKPFGLQTGRLDQSLHDHAILFRFLAQCAQLFLGRLRRHNIESQAQTLKADRHVLRYAESAAKIQVSLDRDVDIFRWYSHGRRNHLARYLRAGGESSQEHISRASSGPGASYSRVGLGTIEGASNGNRASDGSFGLAAFGLESDLRGRRVIAVLLF